MIQLSQTDSGGYLPDSQQISNLFKQVCQYFHWRRTPSYRSARTNEKRLLTKLFMANPDAIEPWIEIVGLRDGYDRHEESGAAWKTLIALFRKTLQDRCSRWLIRELPTQSEFLRHVIRDEKYGHLYKELILDLDGPVWKKRRGQLLSNLRSKPSNTTLQNNAYDLLTWLASAVTEDRGDAQNARALLEQVDFASALWKACVSEPLNPRAVGSLRDARELLVTMGVGCKTTTWWDQIVKDLPQTTKG
jgi:hypothetical protein